MSGEELSEANHGGSLRRVRSGLPEFASQL